MTQSDRETAVVEALRIARECIAYCRRSHKDAQSGTGFPVEIMIDDALAPYDEPKRKSGHSKLVYDKATRTIVEVTDKPDRLAALVQALRWISARADRGGRRLETAMTACEDIEKFAHDVLARLDEPAAAADPQREAALVEALDGGDIARAALARYGETSPRAGKILDGSHEYQLDKFHTACLMEPDVWYIFRADEFGVKHDLRKDFKTLAAARQWFAANPPIITTDPNAPFDGRARKGTMLDEEADLIGRK